MQNNEIIKPAKYFSELEKSILLALVEKYKYVLECKKSDARTIALKQRTWQALAHEYNSQPSVSLRDFKQLKKCWENIKARTKKIMAHERREKVKRSVSPLLGTHVLGKEKIASMLPEQLYFLQSPPEEEPEYRPDAAAQELNVRESDVRVCDESSCKYGGVCKEDGDGLKCACQFQCHTNYIPVCGSNGDTYQNECFLRRAACKHQKEITVVARGPCYSDNGSGSGEGEEEGSGAEAHRKHSKCGPCKYKAECDEDAENVGDKSHLREEAGPGGPGLHTAHCRLPAALCTGPVCSFLPLADIALHAATTTAVNIGIIGATGLDDPEILEGKTEKYVDTPFGKISDALILEKITNTDCVLLSRHGRQHSIMPSKINYQANIRALKEEGCTHVIVTTACGSLREEIHPSDIIIIDPFINRTMTRPQTFYDGSHSCARGVCCIPMAEPFCPKTREVLIETAKLGLQCHSKGTVVTTEEPRFSSWAESFMFCTWGVDVISMTSVPEVVLAKEAGICYASFAMETDYDCWKEHKEVVLVNRVLKTLK
uniref:S-methyl-5'-thioadenosine phosphorylase n=1 Tax=Oryctolagus cuniculus TaxID=9986 RepID=A0A5F9CYE6_RABIT